MGHISDSCQHRCRKFTDFYLYIYLLCLQQLQEMDEKRINKVQKLIESSTDIERNVMPIMNKCIDGMATAAQMIDCKQVRTGESN